MELLGADWRQYNHFAMFVDALAALKNAAQSGTSNWWSPRCQLVWSLSLAAAGSLQQFEGLHNHHPSCSSRS